MTSLTAPARIGRGEPQGSSLAPFSGRIDEVRIYNRALSAEEIKALYDPGTGLLIDPLLATGAEVKLTGEVVSEDPFQVDGRVLEVNGETVLVLDYGDAAALEAEAARISPGGSSFAPHIEGGPASMVTWAGALHFFRTDTAIVLYVGESPTVIEALTKVMGSQFAGR